ncbi:MAG: hypothetical protein H0Z33_12335 [Bacillaceae bacterium]|nr:hypothetical protein [Bacillaceae bacterium]
MWRSAVDILLRHPVLVGVPFLLDIVFLLVNWRWFIPDDRSMFEINFSLPVGLPSIGDIMPIFTAGDVPYPVSWWLIFPGLFLMALQAYLQGGYITWLNRAVQGKRLNISVFKRQANTHFIKLLSFYIGLFVLSTLLARGLRFLFGEAGVIFFLLIAVTIRLFFILFEFILVVDDRAILETVERSRQLFRQDWKRNVYKTVWAMLIVFIFLFMASGLFDSFLSLMIFDFAYVFIMVYFQIVLMLNYQRIRY